MVTLPRDSETNDLVMKCKDAKATNLPTFHLFDISNNNVSSFSEVFFNPFFFSISIVFQTVMNVKIPSTMIATRMLYVTTQLDHLSAFVRKALQEMEKLVQVTKIKY